MTTLKSHFYQVVLSLAIGFAGIFLCGSVYAALTVTINSPTNNQVVSGTIDVSGTINGPDSITGLSYSIDSIAGSPFSLPQSTPFDFLLNTTTLSNGNHTIFVKVQYGFGSANNASVLINVQNGVQYSCAGFMSPFDQVISLKSKVDRAIPLKAQILDANNNIVTDSTIAGAVPVVDVSYLANNSVTAVDVSNELLSPGQSSVGNAFSYDPTTQTWIFNISTKPYTAAGTYTVKMLSGDATMYDFNPKCQGTFVRN